MFNRAIAIAAAVAAAVSSPVGGATIRIEPSPGDFPFDALGPVSGGRHFGPRKGGKRYPHSSVREWKRFGRQAVRGQLRPENGLEVRS